MGGSKTDAKADRLRQKISQLQSHYHQIVKQNQVSGQFQILSQSKRIQDSIQVLDSNTKSSEITEANLDEDKNLDQKLKQIQEHNKQEILKIYQDIQLKKRKK